MNFMKALVDLYDELLRTGTIAKAGWTAQKVKYALHLSENGELIEIFPTVEKVEGRAKTIEVPMQMNLPAETKRSSNIEPFFGADNCKYLLGFDENGNTEDFREHFLRARDLHHKILGSVNTKTAKAILKFFDNWEPKTGLRSEVIQQSYQHITKNTPKLIFYVDDFFQKDEKIAKAWDEYYAVPSGNPVGQCALTGKMEPIATKHPSIKGIFGGQGSGNAIVGCNFDAVESYGLKKNYNSPVSESASVAYTTALNWLLSSRETSYVVGDTTILCWSDKIDSMTQKVAMSVVFNAQPNDLAVREKVQEIAAKIMDCEPASEYQLDEEEHIYFLGLKPLASRTEICFFYENEFTPFLRNVQKHYKNLLIHANNIDTNSRHLSLWQMTKEVSKNEEEPDMFLYNKLIPSILYRYPYPPSLLTNLMSRVRAKQDVTWQKAAILKAYYTRNKNLNCPQEALTMTLNRECTDVAYLFGRMFAVYELIIQKPSDRENYRKGYFCAAMTSPTRVAGRLAYLGQIHLRKVQKEFRPRYEKELMEINNMIHTPYPAFMTTMQQSLFCLGYYHEKNFLFTKKEKEEKEDQENE